MMDRFAGLYNCQQMCTKLTVIVAQGQASADSSETEDIQCQNGH
jgi:hypothetical protein